MFNKKLIILLSVFCISVSPILSFGEELTESIPQESGESDNSNYDFRKFRWGDTQETVEAIEGSPNDEADMKSLDAHYIYYSTTLAGKSAELGYYFCDEGLFQTRFIMTEEHSNENLYIDDYNDIVNALKKKYGEPDTEWERWQDDDKKDYYSGKKGDALCYGYLSYYTWWEDIDGRTDVFIKMSADNYNITTTVDFSSTEISAGEADYSDDF